MQTVTLSPRFLVVIPRAIRERLKLQPGQKMMLTESRGGIRLLPLKPPGAFRGIARGIDTGIVREADRTLQPVAARPRKPPTETGA